MKQIIRLLLFISLSVNIINVYGQDLTQTIRGTVIDGESEITIPSATVFLIYNGETVVTATDVNGNFRFEDVPVGRVTVKVSYISYEDCVLPEIMVGSAKEIVLTVPMQESVNTISEVVVKADKDKGKPKNEMALLSSRSFTVEETKRYAAGLSDPGRMALSFAGVAGGEDVSNEIIIRGNSPNGLLWRLEGIEIPGPNHFAEEGSSAGYVSILSSNMISTSDFFTGAFPAEYGNALSGVFDISLRKGNNEKREYAFQFGALGTEFSLEGPFSKNYKGSYLINYRYSTLALLDKIGINVVGDQTPVYQDLSFNLHFPTRKTGSFTLWGIGGVSSSPLEAKKDSSLWESTVDRMNDLSEMNMFATGLTHVYFPDKQSYFKSVISYSGTGSLNEVSILNDQYIPELDTKNKFENSAVRASFFYNRKFNSKLTTRTGFIAGNIMFDMTEGYNNEQDQWVENINKDGNAMMYQSYFQAKYKFTKELTLNGGLHYLHFALNNKHSVEPRVALKWNFSQKQSIGIGAGLHSRHEQLSVYFTQPADKNGSSEYPNKDLDLTKAIHYVLSYENSLSPNLKFKAETYYQDLFNVPVTVDKNSTISTINGAWQSDKELVSNGKGVNYGLELSLEKFFSNNYYFMVNSSLFDSKFQAADGNWYNTKYNLGYVNNFIGGKEFKVGNNKTNILGLNGKFIWSGGKRNTPVNIESSLEEGFTVRDHDKLYINKEDDYFRLDVSVSYRINKSKAAHIISLDIQNTTNRDNILFQDFNPETQKIDVFYQTGLTPIFNYRIEF